MNVTLLTAIQCVLVAGVVLCLSVIATDYGSR